MRNTLLASVIAGALLSGCAESEKDVSINNVDSANPVSYTHLTLPTILLV